ncbi:MAG: CAP domain-containing protein [Myxococcales bacterium]|nr:CAP domain-containing protein [Myxococcales bacterium]MCB9520868.1 CAP domain-containing protein [Myxococcales bacterium]MCB9532222.1 CAP domain-containing protein [Myxococcales bacterium]
MTQIRPSLAPHALLALAALLGSACGDDVNPWGFLGFGDAGIDAADGDVGFGGDTAGSSDAGVRDTGAGGDAAADEAGPETCGENEHLDAGECLCDEGFLRTARGCLPLPDTDPETRTVAQLCARWTADYPERARTIYTPGPTRCDPGTIDPTAHEDAMRRLNLFRWLVGLEPASENAANARLAQYASVMFAVNDQLSHFPPTSWDCYTAEGAEAAGSSNIAWGYSTAASTVDGYVGDEGVPSLGHRRWCLFPDLDDVGFGHYDDGGAMWSFGSTSRPRVDFVGYPPPGPVPTSAIMGEWSFSTDASLSGATIEVTDLATGSSVPLTQDLKDSGYGQETIGYTPSRRARTGDRFEITVTRGSQVWSYETEFVSCP